MWVRFNEDLKKDGEVIFSKKKKYALQLEQKEHYLVSDEPNSINCTTCCRFDKKDEGTVFTISEF